MPVLTGANGALTWATVPVAKCRSWSLSIDKEMLDDTDLSVWDRTYVEGKRGAAGTAVLLYDPSNATATTIINRILTNNAAADALALVLNTKTNKNIAYNVRINSAAVVMATREAVAVTIGFTATGPATGTIAGA